MERDMHCKHHRYQCEKEIGELPQYELFHLNCKLNQRNVRTHAEIKIENICQKVRTNLHVALLQQDILFYLFIQCLDKSGKSATYFSYEVSQSDHKYIFQNRCWNLPVYIFSQKRCWNLPIYKLSQKKVLTSANLYIFPNRC